MYVYVYRLNSRYRDFNTFVAVGKIHFSFSSSVVSIEHSVPTVVFENVF